MKSKIFIPALMIGFLVTGCKSNEVLLKSVPTPTPVASVQEGNAKGVSVTHAAITLTPTLAPPGAETKKIAKTENKGKETQAQASKEVKLNESKILAPQEPPIPVDTLIVSVEPPTQVNVAGHNFDYASEPKDGLILVRKGDKWFFMNEKGKNEFGKEFTYAEEFTEGVSLVVTEQGGGLLSRDGKYVLAPNFKSIYRLGIGEYAVESAGKLALVNKDGIFLTKNIYDTITNPMLVDSHCVLLIVSRFGKYGCIDGKGSVLVEPKYDAIGGIEGNNTYLFDAAGDALVDKNIFLTQNKSGEAVKYGFIDHTGKILCEPILKATATFIPSRTGGFYNLQFQDDVSKFLIKQPDIPQEDTETKEIKGKGPMPSRIRDETTK